MGDIADWIIEQLVFGPEDDEDFGAWEQEELTERAKQRLAKLKEENPWSSTSTSRQEAS